MSVTIAVIVEGRTETAFKPALLRYLELPLRGRMPNLLFRPQNGRIPTGNKLRRLVEQLLEDRQRSVDAVIALTDIYTGTREFSDADDAKRKMTDWVGNNPRFFPHVALHDFEAWLLSYWPTIQRIAQSTRPSPGQSPETVNHDRPPAERLREIFRLGRGRDDYVKTRDATRILREADLSTAIDACPELKAFINRITTLSGGQAID